MKSIKQISIKKYGDLTSKLFVSFDEEYKFNSNEKNWRKLNFKDLKAEYNKQSDTPIIKDLTIENIVLILKNIDKTTLIKSKIKKYSIERKAKIKKHSIETYGDLTNEIFTSINLNSKKIKFYVAGNKENAINAKELVTEYFKQTGKKISTKKQFKKILNINQNSLKKRKIKLDSFNQYGDLTSKLSVSYEEGEYKFKTPRKRYEKINFNDLKVEYNKQSDTLITGDLTIENIDSLLSNIDSISLTNANSKKASIDTYGDLITNNLIVSFEETEFKFNVEENTKLNLFYLNKQLNIQGDTEEDYTINNFGSLNIDALTLEKAKAKKNSIDTYGDLKTTLFVSFDGEYKFNEIENEANKLNFVDLKVEYNKQSDAPITGDLTILNIGNVEGSLLTNIDETTLEEAKTKAKKHLKTKKNKINSVSPKQQLKNQDDIKEKDTINNISSSVLNSHDTTKISTKSKTNIGITTEPNYENSFSSIAIIQILLAAIVFVFIISFCFWKIFKKNKKKN